VTLAVPLEVDERDGLSDATARPARRTAWFPLALVLVAGLGLATGLAIVDALPVGVVADDAFYVILARSLATGQGYHALNLPGHPAGTHFPPGYPALLALLSLVAPAFPGNIAVFKAFNAQPISLDISEMYLALTQNTVDGYEFPLISVVATKLHEVTKFVSETNHVYNAMALLGSKIKLDKLDPAHLKILREEAQSFGSATRKSTVEASAAAKKTCQDAGVQFKIANKYAFFYCEIIFPRGVKEKIRSTITMLANTLVSVQKAIVDR